ncbi:MAG TPA: ATP-binding protein, partial [Ktedonobacterales bacterium]
GFTMWRRRQPATPPMVEIQVKDAGHGIPPDQMPLLFNRFVRLPRDLASKVPGTGIGLYLCRVMSEAMGGRVWAESTGVEGEGSTFFVHLPFATASSLPQAASTVPLSR